MQKFYFSSINLGCPKNLVDTQYLLGNLLTQASNNPNYDIKYFPEFDNKEVSFVFLNTCGFIKSGRDEMFQIISQILNQNKKIYLLGCGLQYFQKLLKDKTDGISKFEQEKRESFFSNPDVFAISRDDIDQISLSKLIKGYSSKTYGDFHNLNNTRAFTNIDLGFEYCKIADGCNNSCSFCIIPKIRGKQKSKPFEEILTEIENMVSSGAKEIILISQDTTRYGIDLYFQPSLLQLAKKINGLQGNFLFRVLYLYPDILTENYLEEFAKLEKFIPYFDIPLQHISDNLLKSMGRYYDTDKIYKFLKKIKKLFPISYIRTNFIVGFPGETDENILELKNFIEKDFFDNVALFEYHDEPLSASSKLSNKVPDKIISQRFNLLKKQRDDIYSQKKSTDLNWGYVVSRDENFVEVRPWLHCPDIDKNLRFPLDKVFLSEDEFDVGARVSW